MKNWRCERNWGKAVQSLYRCKGIKTKSRFRGWSKVFEKSTMVKHDGVPQNYLDTEDEIKTSNWQRLKPLKRNDLARPQLTMMLKQEKHPLKRIITQSIIYDFTQSLIRHWQNQHFCQCLLFNYWNQCAMHNQTTSCFKKNSKKKKEADTNEAARFFYSFIKTLLITSSLLHWL